MSYIITIILFVLLYSTRKSRMDSTTKRMLSLFLIYWIVSLCLAKLRVFGLNEVSEYTFLLIGIGVFSFSAGFLIPARYRQTNSVICKEDISRQIERLADSVLYKLLLIASSIYLYTLLVVFFDKMEYYGSLYDVRNDYYAGALYGSLFAQINAFILHPLYLITMPLFAYMILYKRNWICLLSGFFVFGYESLGGGRLGYIRIVMGVVFMAYCLLQTYKYKKREGYMTAITGGVLIFVLLSFVSAARTGELGANSNVRIVGTQMAAENIVTYTAGPIVAFDYSVQKDYSSYMNGYQYGNLTLTPVISMINLFSTRIGYTIPLSLSVLGEYKQGALIQIGNDMNWNALYTANLYFYNDLGIIGVFLFPFLFGLIISVILNKLYKYNSLPLVMIMSFCFWAMIDSVLDYAFISPYDLLTLIVFYFMGTRKKYLQTR